jgi:hypothetical protein
LPQYVVEDVGLVQALASDDLGVYWARLLSDGGSMFVIALDAGDSHAQVETGSSVEFITPRSTEFVFSEDTLTGYHLAEINRASRVKTEGGGIQSPPHLLAGSEQRFVLAFPASGWTLQTIQPFDTTISDGLPPLGGLQIDDTAIYATAPSASQILAFRSNGQPVALLDGAAPLGPLAEAAGKLYWLTESGDVMSLPASGGAATTHGNVPQASAIAVAEQCVYVMTPTDIRSVDLSNGEVMTVAAVKAVALTASSLGVFWISPGRVEGRRAAK